MGKLFHNWLYKYQHVERIKSPACQGLLDGEVFVQEKLDGSNLTIATDPDSNKIVICSRNNPLYHSDTVHNGFDGAVNYVLNHTGLQELMRRYPNWILRGEWLRKNHIQYDQTNHKRFYLFDVELITKSEQIEYVHPSVWRAAVDTVNAIENIESIRVAPILTTITNPSLEDLQQYANGPSQFGPQREGIVIKNYQYQNTHGERIWGKIISDSFQNKITANCDKKEYHENKFVTQLVNPHFVLKEMYKLKETNGELVIQMMKTIIDHCWLTILKEELINFVLENKVEKFNFKFAKTLCDRAVQRIAVSYFNGEYDEYDLS